MAKVKRAEHLSGPYYVGHTKNERLVFMPEPPREVVRGGSRRRERIGTSKKVLAIYATLIALAGVRIADIVSSDTSKVPAESANYPGAPLNHNTAENPSVPTDR